MSVELYPHFKLTADPPTSSPAKGYFGRAKITVVDWTGRQAGREMGIYIMKGGNDDCGGGGAQKELKRTI